MVNLDRKVTQMLWAPLESLSSTKRTQYRHTDVNGDTHYVQYYTDNGTNIRRLIEHAFNYPVAMQNSPLSHIDKARCFALTLLPPATGIYQQVLQEQITDVGGANNIDLDDTLKAYILKRLGDHGQKAAYRQLEGLKSVKKPLGIEVFEWDSLFFIGNDIVDWLPGTEAKMADETLLRAYLDSFPDKWVQDFESTKTYDMADTSRSAITSHMMEKESASRTARLENERKQKVNNHGNSNGKKRTQEGDRDSKRPAKQAKKFGKGKHTESNKDWVGPPRDDEQCRLHPYSKHIWSDCNQHPKNLGKKPKARKSSGSKESDEDGHVVSDPSSKDAATDVSELTVDLVGSGKLQSSLFTTLKPSDESHHLDCFALNVLNDEQPLIPSSAMSSTTTSGKHSVISLTRIQRPLNTCGRTDTSVEKSKEALETEVANRLTEELFSNEPSSEQIIRGSSNNEIIKDTKLDLSPTTVLVAKTIQGIHSKKPLRVLLDSGSSCDFIYPAALPKAAKPQQLDTAVSVGVLNTETSVSQKVILNDIVLTELSHSLHIDNIECYVGGVAKYDIILGRRTLRKLGIVIDFDHDSVKWRDKIIPMKPPLSQPRMTRFRQIQQQYLASFEDQADALAPEGSDFLDANFTSVEILESKYDKADTDEVANMQKHLSPAQREELKVLLRKFTRLFSGKLGSYPHRKMHLDVSKEDRKRLRYQKPYPVPQVHSDLFYTELKRLVSLGVLTEVKGLAEFAAPTFLIPKKDGRVRWISDFRELNKIIRRREYPLPHINKILRKRNKYSFFTKLDISMQYYTFELDEESKDLCMISTPFGTYQYNRAPMGVKQTPDFAQQVMEETLRGIHEQEAYIDDVGVFGKPNGSFSDHLEVLEKVLTRLQDANFTINPLKCEWAVQETDFLGFWLTPTGLKPWKKKVQAILDLKSPTTVKQVRSFIGAVTFYREMFPKRSHVLAPLYQLTETKGKRRFLWTDECESAFKHVKAMLAKDVFIRYPDPNKPFHVYTDASDIQLGAVIVQDNKPVAYFSRKLNSAQRNYTTMEKELLSIVTTFQEYRTMLYGVRELHVHTDHKNLTYANLNSQRVLRWRLFLEEFSPIFHYIKGESNTLADALSRLPIQEGQSGESTAQSAVTSNSSHEQKNSMHAPSGTPDAYSLLVDDDELLECFLAFPEVTPDKPFVLDYESIANKQRAEGCLQLVQNDSDHYSLESVVHDGPQLVVFKAYTNARPRIRIPDSMLEEIVQFYHLGLSHVGMVRLQRTIASNFMHPSLNQVCMRVALHCDTCQKTKLFGQGYGHLPPREAHYAPWQEVAVDLIGPWTIYDKDAKEHSFTALTIIDTVTTFCEVVLLRNKTAEHVGHQFETQWLSRYPRPKRCVYDQGNEFLGEAFQAKLRNAGIHPAASTVKNPQSNAVCERLHQSIGNALRVLNYDVPPNTFEDATERIESALQTAAYAARTAIHSTMMESPGNIAFHRDMLLNIPLIVDFELMRQRRQALIDKSLIRANAKRIDFDYQPGQLVLKQAPADRKLDQQALGPYPITRIHTNGTVVIRLSPDITERINIRRIKPYRP